MAALKKILGHRLLKFIPVLVLLVYGFAVTCDATPRAMRAPRAASSSAARTGRIETATVQLVLLQAIRFFQKNISPLDGPRCVFYPTCSHYGYRAIAQYGALKGIMMTGDRMIRCNPSRKDDPDYHLLPNGRLYDPVARNASIEE